MRAKHFSWSLLHKIVDHVATAQRVYLKAVTQDGQSCQNPNRPFAALNPSVSLADEADAGKSSSIVHFGTIGS